MVELRIERIAAILENSSSPLLQIADHLRETCRLFRARFRGRPYVLNAHDVVFFDVDLVDRPGTHTLVVHVRGTCDEILAEIPVRVEGDDECVVCEARDESRTRTALMDAVRSHGVARVHRAVHHIPMGRRGDVLLFDGWRTEAERILSFANGPVKEELVRRACPK
jgi:hypothetical protein